MPDLPRAPHGLLGVGVLVTRPEDQAESLCRLFEASGAKVVRWPTIVIEPIAAPRDSGRSLPSVDSFDIVIVTSANAVRFGADLLDGTRQGALAAIGAATARALAVTGHSVAITPPEGADSESLLKHREFADLAGRRVLIVKGRGGREWLPDELTRRGAEVHTVDVYRRERRVHDAAEHASLEARFAAGEIHVITATSAEIALNLLESAPQALRGHFDRVRWVVPGSRVAASVRDHGLKSPILQAASAQDQDLVAAVVAWRAAESGA